MPILAQKFLDVLARRDFVHRVCFTLFLLLCKLLHWPPVSTCGQGGIWGCAANQVGSRVSGGGCIFTSAHRQHKDTAGFGSSRTRGKQQIIQRPTFPTTTKPSLALYSFCGKRRESCAAPGNNFCHLVMNGQMNQNFMKRVLMEKHL